MADKKKTSVVTNIKPAKDNKEFSLEGFDSLKPIQDSGKKTNKISSTDSDKSKK